MDPFILIKAAILGVVEGLTEFLPVSSTGHLILAGQLLNFTGEKAKLFEIVIQSGAIAAVVVEYRARFFGALKGITHDAVAQRFWINLAIAFMPLAVLGLLFNKMIKGVLFHAVPVALAFIVGGLIILWVERPSAQAARTPRVLEVDDMTWRDALKLGCAQAFGLIPGTSRSGATIIGGMLFGLSRKAATEFSFFLGVPTLLAATVYSLYKERHLLDLSDAGMWLVGMSSAFASAFVCVRWLIRYVATHTLVPFAWYRIGFGALVLLTAYFNLIDWRA